LQKRFKEKKNYIYLEEKMRVSKYSFPKKKTSKQKKNRNNSRRKHFSGGEIKKGDWRHFGFLYNTQEAKDFLANERKEKEKEEEKQFLNWYEQGIPDLVKYNNELNTIFQSTFNLINYIPSQINIKDMQKLQELLKATNTINDNLKNIITYSTTFYDPAANLYEVARNWIDGDKQQINFNLKNGGKLKEEKNKLNQLITLVQQRNLGSFHLSHRLQDISKNLYEFYFHLFIRIKVLEILSETNKISIGENIDTKVDNEFEQSQDLHKTISNMNQKMNNVPLISPINNNNNYSEPAKQETNLPLQNPRNTDEVPPFLREDLQKFYMDIVNYIKTQQLPPEEPQLPPVPPQSTPVPPQLQPEESQLQQQIAGRKRKTRKNRFRQR
jgi:hypothetical protein